MADRKNIVMTRSVTRRGAMSLGLAAISTAALATPDRPVSRGAGFWGRAIRCDNDAVPISDIAARIARISDFEGQNACRVMKDNIEGPYFTCVGPKGKDIAGDRAGMPLVVALRVQDTACRPLPGAAVDIWACDARGNYSGYTASPDEFARTGSHLEPETEQRFCRGVLKTDVDGIAEFNTIYPGYYAGRAIHIHFKVHASGKTYVTSQALMPEETNLTVLHTAPYNAPRGTRRVTNAEEAGERLPIFRVIRRNESLIAILPITLES